jgi:hypothetical protein
MPTTVELAEIAEAILWDLELPALRARYRFWQTLGFGSNIPCFYSEPYARGKSEAEAKLLFRDAQELNEHLRVTPRFMELTSDGIRPRIVLDGSYDYHSELKLLVEFDECGRRILEGSSIAGRIE